MLNGGMRGWLDRLAGLERYYFAVDGGAGAALLAHLPGVDDRLRPADSPRHADTLLVVEPITIQLMDALGETYRSLGAPRRVVVVGTAGMSVLDGGAPLVRLEDHLPVTVRVAGSTTPESASSTAAAVALAMHRPSDARRRGESELGPEEVLIPLRSTAEREIATEDVILSVGPVQSPAAGPLRLLLTMDGEQIVRTEVRGGYASRDLERISRARRWDAGPELAAILDPLAPVAGRAAYVQAVEALSGIEPPSRARSLRDIALCRERAANHMLWLVGFAAVLGYPALAWDARRVARACADITLAAEAVIPGGWDSRAAGNGERLPIPAGLPEEVRRLARRIRGDRLFALRTRGIGVLAAARATQAGASGPVLLASETGEGDAWARTLARMEAAADNLQQALELAGRLTEGDERRPWPGTPPPPGAAESETLGPRGRLTLQVESDGGEQPAGIHWARPSAVHLTLVPELIAGHTLPDALTAVASLDLSMAEADG